ncbi:MAG: cyclic nucleotide-binding domain-containing protein [Motiliproteus sp.]
MRTIPGRQLLEQLGIDYFKGGSSFGALSDQAITYLLEKGEVLQLSTEDRLFACDDPVDGFFIILQGSIAFYRPREGGSTHIRDYIFGQEVGFVAMIGLHDRVGDTYAAEPSFVLHVSTALFNELHMDLPNEFGVFLLNISREMARRLQESDRKLADNAIDE